MIYLVGTADTKLAELLYLKGKLELERGKVALVDVSTGRVLENPCIDIDARSLAAHHPQGAEAVFEHQDRGQAVTAMGAAFTEFCTVNRNEIDAMIGIGGGGGTSIIAPGLRELPYGVPKVIVSTLASGDTAPYVGTSDMIMIPSVTDMAGLNRISRHILHNAAMALLGMAAHPFEGRAEDRPSVGLSMFGVTTQGVTKVTEHLRENHDCIVFHATGTGGRSMEQLLAEGMLKGLIDLTTTEIADELVGGVLSAGATRLDTVVASGKPYVGSVGALDMVNFWAPDTVPAKFKGRLFHHHNTNVTLMRTTEDECRLIGAWMAAKLNRAQGPVHILLPEKGISALDTEGGPFWDPVANAALFGAIKDTFSVKSGHHLVRLPYHINSPEFAAIVADTFVKISPE